MINDSSSHFDNNHDPAVSSGVLEGVSIPGAESNNYDNNNNNDNNKKSASKEVAREVVWPIKDAETDTLTGQSPSLYSIGEEKKLGSSSRSVATSSFAGSGSGSFNRTILVTSMIFAVLANAAPTNHDNGISQPALGAELASASALDVIGRIASWLSSVLYLCSRPPQLYKNYCRKSTSGLSPLLFMAAFCGNLFYSASLLTNPNAWFDFPPYGGGGWADEQGNSRLEWIGRSLPFFLGAAGVLGLDAMMGVQFLVYGSDEAHEPMVKVSQDGKDGRRHSRWMKVHGWMRGWIPSVSPERKPSASGSVISSEEAEVLLPRDGQANGYGGV